MKKIIKKILIVMLTIATILPASGMQVSAAERTPFVASHTPTRNDGGGAYGTHKYPSYTEGATQYYRDGDIIELNVTLPKGHGSGGIVDIVKFDSTKLELVSPFRDIRSSLGKNFYDKDWSLHVSNYDGNTDQISLTATAYNVYDTSCNEFDGGTIAKLYFRVKDGVENEVGNPITFEFPSFQAVEVIDGVSTYRHEGYDPNDPDTTEVALESVTIVAKKPSVNLTAVDGFITQSQARALNSVADLKTFNNVSVTTSDGSTIDINTQTDNFNAIKAGTIGTYDVTYSYTYNGMPGSKTVKLTVIEDDVIISEDKTVALRAKGTILTETQARALASESSLIPLNDAKVYLSTGGTANPNISVPAFGSLKAGIIGSYDVTYSYGTGTSAVSKTVKVTVVKDDSIISEDKEVALYAENAFIRVSEAKALNNRNGLIPFNKAAVTLATGASAQPVVTVDGAQWLALNSGTEGTYRVLYSYGTGTSEVNKQVNVTVIADDAEVSEDGLVSLTAESITLSQSEAKALATQTELMHLTGAKVVLADGTNAIPNMSVPQFTNIKLGIVGTYDIEYTYGTGTSAVSKTVTVTIEKDKKHEIEATSAQITQSEAKALSNKEDLRDVNNVLVKAVDGSNPNAVVTTNDFAAIKAGKLGVYNVTYSYGSGAAKVEVTVSVTVVEDGSEMNELGSLYAKNAFITSSQAKALTMQSQLLPINEAKMTLIDGTIVDPSVTITTANWVLLRQGELGTYNVTYSYGSGSQTLRKAVTITVIRDESETSEDGTVSLYAENAFITSSQAKAINNKEQLRSYNKAEVTLVNGDTVNANVTISQLDLLAIKAGTVGSYDVVYSYGTGAKEVIKTVKITVIGDDPVISPDGKVALNAIDGAIADDEAKALTDKNQLAAINEATITLADGTKTTPNIAISTTNWNSIKNGQLGTYTLTYYYGEVGEDNYVEKTVKITVEKRVEARMLFDYDKNNKIDIIDIVEFRRIMAGPSRATAAEIILSDANMDGKVDIIDLAEILYYSSNPSMKPPTVYIPLG